MTGDLLIGVLMTIVALGLMVAWALHEVSRVEEIAARYEGEASSESLG